MARPAVSLGEVGASVKIVDLPGRSGPVTVGAGHPSGALVLRRGQNCRRCWSPGGISGTAMCQLLWEELGVDHLPIDKVPKEGSLSLLLFRVVGQDIGAACVEDCAHL